MDASEIEAKVKHFLATIPGILSVSEVKYFVNPMMDTFPAEGEVILHDFANEQEGRDEIAWLKHVLALESVSGEFYILWEGKGPVARPWAKASLSPNYEWVEPLWTLGHGVYFCPAVEKLDTYSAGHKRGIGWPSAAASNSAGVR